VQQRETLSRERQRLMQDIHDGMGSQLMSALKVAEAGKLSEPQMAMVLRECIDDLKLTVDSLEPVEADLLLLLATLRYRLLPRLRDASLRLRWEVADVPPLVWLDPRSALHILRILQEGISNVMQHAGATELRVATVRGGAGRGRDPHGQRPRLQPAARRRDGARAVEHGAARACGRRRGVVGGDAEGTRFRLWLPLRRAHGRAADCGVVDAGHAGLSGRRPCAPYVSTSNDTASAEAGNDPADVRPRAASAAARGW
jgi:two-component sensor histidine kinase